LGKKKEDLLGERKRVDPNLALVMKILERKNTQAADWTNNVLIVIAIVLVVELSAMVSSTTAPTSALLMTLLATFTTSCVLLKATESRVHFGCDAPGCWASLRACSYAYSGPYKA